MWTFYELSEDDKRQLMKENPLVQAVQQHQREHAAPGGQANPLMGQPGAAGPRR